MTVAGSSFAGVHLWRVKEVFSNADGTIQFVELATCCGGAGGETNTAGGRITTSVSAFVIPTNVVAPTVNKHLLLGTAAFATLPGAPTPDHIIPDNFFSLTADTIAFSPWDTLTFASGQLPTDGVASLSQDVNATPPANHLLSSGPNSPTNYADQTGQVNANPSPPAVPDGNGATTPMTVTALDAAGSSLQVAFDVGSCSSADDFHIVYGEGSGLPAATGGAFTLLGAVCSLGTSTPVVWSAVPEATDGSNVIWFMVVATNAAAAEGSWGLDSAGGERLGPHASGASGVCAFNRSLTNACGHP